MVLYCLIAAGFRVCLLFCCFSLCFLLWLVGDVNGYSLLADADLLDCV